MCGIVGYVGPQPALPIVVEGMRRLEYRGYDSAGVAVENGHGIEVVRAVGKLQALAEALAAHALTGTTGIGHTRWATHGRPSEANAHPHVSGGVALVHNGIIENHGELRAELAAAGVEFRSQTDTEILAHLVRRLLDVGTTTLAQAVMKALERVRGTYAIAVLSETEPGTLVAARSGSPLVLGHAGEAMLCGSDVAALLPHTRDMIFLEDGDVAELKRGNFAIVARDGALVERTRQRIDWSPTMAERGGFKHFMLKEIYEQPEAIASTLRGRVDVARGDVFESEMGLDAESAASVSRVYIVACGTSYHAALVGRYWLEELAGIPTIVEHASEAAGRRLLVSPGDLMIAVSQSGETYDTIAALRGAKRRGARILAICNVLGSQIPRMADGTLYTRAGPEIGVASTKCFTAQLAALFMLAIYLGRRRGTLAADAAMVLLRALAQVPAQMNELLGDADYVRSVALRFVQARDVLFLGRGYQFPIALEGALKLKEVSYAHAEGYPAGEMKHGPIALIDRDLPVVVLAPRSSSYDKTLGNIQEVRARDGVVVAIATRGDEAMHDLADHILWVPDADEAIQPLLAVLPLQLLAYYVAVRRGHDVDQPRNLAKTVTVE